jgi:hypothetical protein
MAKNYCFAGKGLTLIQPSASAIAFAGKDIENRSWRTHYRGPIAIHAGGRPPVDGENWMVERNGIERSVLDWIRIGRGAFRLRESDDELPRSHVVAIGMLVDCVEKSDSPWFQGEYGWVLSGVIPIRPVPMTGGLSLWDCEFGYRPLLPQSPNPTVFCWGYDGWGNSTEQLVQIVDHIEYDRGFDPPLFVDIRRHRSVRAVGFQGNAFELLVGSDRYRWLPGLGNTAAETGESGIRIADPSEAEYLFDLVLSQPNRRVIFFCGCRWPNVKRRVSCHRRIVGNLLRAVARRRAVSLQVIEWPGGEPSECDRELKVDGERMQAIRTGRSFLPLSLRLPPQHLRGLAWGSLLWLKAGKEYVGILTGPAQYRAGEWKLPILEGVDADKADVAMARALVLRQEFGLETSCSLT